MNVPRAHHYLPVFYLKGFASPHAGRLWVYEKGKAIRKSIPVKEVHQRDLYSFDDEEGHHRALEQQLAKIESDIAPLFAEIQNGYRRFNSGEWEALTFFMALTWARTPAGMDFVNQISASAMKSVIKGHAENAERFQKEYVEYLKSSGTSTKLTAEDMRAYALGNDWVLHQESHGYTLRKMFDSALTVWPILQAKRWDVLISEVKDGHYFCTSDIPVVTILPDSAGMVTIGTGFEVPGVEAYFPLSSRDCLRLRDRATYSARRVSGKLVREINKFTMVAARRFVYASEKNAAMQAVFDKIGCKSIGRQNAFMLTPS